MPLPHDTFLDRRLDPDAALGLRLSLAVLAAVLAVVPLALLIVLVTRGWAPLRSLDVGVDHSLHAYAVHSPAFVSFLLLVSRVLDPMVFRAACAAVALWLLTRGLPRLAAWVVLTMTVGGLLGVLLKTVVGRSRPHLPDPVASAGGLSFPSGHALNSFLGCGVLLLVFLPALSRRGRIVASSLAAAATALVGFSRVGLGVHYVSDVVGGWVVAATVLAATSAAFETWRRSLGRPASGIEQGVEPEAAGRLTG